MTKPTTNSRHVSLVTRHCFSSLLAAGFALTLSLPARGQTTSHHSSAATQKKKSTAKGAAPRSIVKSQASPSRTSTSKTTSTKKTSTTARRRGKPAEPPVRRQLHPTPERYAEIQSALAKKGYYQGTANGAWGQSSVSALAKFQADNGLEPTGKIDALSLKLLAPGPKSDGNTASVSPGTDSPN